MGLVINGIQYGWGDITFNIDGQKVENIRAIEYGDEQEKEEIYGAGRYSIGRGYGRIKCQGKVTLGFEEVERMRAKSPTGSLLGYKAFDIVVSFQPESGGAVITHTLKGCEFKKDDAKWKEGDTKSDVDLDLVIQRIVRK